MATRQCMNKWHFSDWLIVTRQFLVGCLSGQPWKEEDSTTTFNQEKHGTFRISDEPRIHIYRQNRCSQMQQSNTTRAMWRHNQKSKSCKREEEKKHGPSKKYGAYIRYVTRDILPSPVKKVGNILACHINGLCTICLGDGWFVQDTRKTLGEVRLVCLVCCMLLLHM